jgi:S-adenosylmethionine hydrolase
LVSSRIEGKVVAITADGDLVTDITSQQLEGVPRDERVRVCCDEHETVGIFSPDHGEPDSTFLALIGDAGTLELAIVGLSAGDMLGIRVGEKVVVEW